MLDEAYTLREAVNKITEMRDMKLRDYEIDTHEWAIVEQLRDLLKVRTNKLFPFFEQTNDHYRFSRMRPFFFHGEALLTSPP